MQTGSWLLLATSIVAAFGVSGTRSYAESMTGLELRELYSKDVTECGAFPQGKELIEYCELWQVGGSIIGRSDTDYRGSYRIMVSQGEVCVMFGDLPESCGPYQSLGQDKYRIVFANGSYGVVKILPGDVNGLN